MQKVGVTLTVGLGLGCGSPAPPKYQVFPGDHGTELLLAMSSISSLTFSAILRTNQCLECFATSSPWHFRHLGAHTIWTQGSPGAQGCGKHQASTSHFTIIAHQSFLLTKQ